MRRKGYMKDSFRIEKLSQEDFKEYWNKYKFEVFRDDHSYHFWDLVSDEEKNEISELRKPFESLIEIRLAIFNNNDDFVGWSWGFQESHTTFYVANSAILPDYRRKGLYTMLLNRMLDEAIELGFQLIYSRHCATNNRIIIPKLKRGFVISKMELDDVFGVLVHLHFYANETRRLIMDYRSGQKKPNEKIKALFNI
jgi:GNAT superfamily N-acetyltransferase